MCHDFAYEIEKLDATFIFFFDASLFMVCVLYRAFCGLINGALIVSHFSTNCKKHRFKISHALGST